MTSFFKIPMVLALMLSLGSCNLTSQDVAVIAATTATVLPALDQSKARQRQLALGATQQYFQSNKRSSDRRLEGKLRAMVSRIARANGIADTWQVFLIDDKVPNAATPGGGIVFVHSGMVPLARTEAQMAMILAHEMAHSEKGHLVRRMRDLSLLGGATQIAGSRLAPGLSTAALGAFAQASASGYSRRAETEADTVGFRYYTKAGYDPRQAPEIFRNLARAFQGPDAVTQFFHGSHPTSTSRAARLQKRANRLSPGGTVDTADYARLTARYR